MSKSHWTLSWPTSSRAKRTAGQLPASQRLTWLQARDGEERSEWVAKFRDSTIPLGQVIKETMVARDAHWLPTTAMLQTPAASGAAAADPKTNPLSNQFQLGKPINGKAVAKVLKDGTKLCQGFQHGQCKNKTPCALGQHRCGLVTKERTCLRSSRSWGGQLQANPQVGLRVP